MHTHTQHDERERYTRWKCERILWRKNWTKKTTNWERIKNITPPTTRTTTKHKKMIIMRIKLQMYIVAAATAANIARRYYDFNLIVMLFVCISQPWISPPSLWLQRFKMRSLSRLFRSRFFPTRSPSLHTLGLTHRLDYNGMKCVVCFGYLENPNYLPKTVYLRILYLVLTFFPTIIHPSNSWVNQIICIYWQQRHFSVRIDSFWARGQR